MLQPWQQVSGTVQTSKATEVIGVAQGTVQASEAVQATIQAPGATRATAEIDKTTQVTILIDRDNVTGAI